MSKENQNNVNIEEQRLQDKSQMIGGTIDVTAQANSYTSAMIFVQGTTGGVNPGTGAYNVSLYGNNTNTVGTADGIYLKADGANQYIVFPHFEDIRMFGVGKGIHISAANTGGGNYVNGATFDDIVIDNPVYGVYVDADVTNSNEAAGNIFNVQIQALSTTTAGIWCNSVRNYFRPVLWDFVGSTNTINFTSTAGLNNVDIVYPINLDDGAGMIDSGQNDNVNGRHYNGTIQIDSRSLTSGTLNLTNTVTGIAKSLALQNYVTSGGLVGSAIYMGYNTIAGGTPSGIRLVDQGDPAHTMRGIFQLQTHNDTAGDNASTWINTLTSDYNGNIGLGTNVPRAELDVESTVSPAVFFAAVPGQNVGIGTLQPGTALDIQGTARMTGFSMAGVTSTTVTGTGSVVLSTSPTFVTPILGTPTSGVATNFTGTAAGLTAGTVTTNANLTGPITSSGNATSIAAQTGTGTTFAMQTAPVFSGSVGIGTISPNGTLNITGGNVGIGSASPGSVFDVQGTVRHLGAANVPLIKLQQTGTSNLNGIGYNGAGQSNSGLTFYSSGNAAEATFWDNGSLSIGSSVTYYNHDTNANGLLVQGNVGIGSINPRGALDVSPSGTIYGQALTGFSGTSQLSTIRPTGSTITLGGSSETVAIGATLGEDFGTFAAKNIGTLSVGSSTAPTNGVAYFNGNVGIGSTNPGQKLDVQGTIRVSLVGATIAIPPGSNACKGQSALSTGTVTISTTCTPANGTDIFVTDGGGGVLANLGSLQVGTVTAGTSFICQSSNNLDSSNCNWLIIKDN